jgi:hypothetical protein
MFADDVVFADVLIAVELAFLGFAIWHHFLNDPPQFKVKEDIWGVYPKQATEADVSQEVRPVLIFSKHSSAVIIEMPDNRNHPNGPKRPSGNLRKAA